MVACTESGTLSRTLTVLCTQQRWCRVPGKISLSAFQKPSAPSPTAISGAICNPRCLMSIRSSRQLCALSADPGLDRPRRAVTMPHDTGASVGKLQVFHRGKKGLDFDLD